MTYRAAYAALSGLVPPDGSKCLRVERATAEDLIAAVSSLYPHALDSVGACVVQP